VVESLTGTVRTRVGQGLRALLGRSLHGLRERLPWKLELRRKRSTRPPGERNRYSYQKQHVHFGLEPGWRVLDLGSGGDPFPAATILLERYIRPVFRTESLVTGDKPLVVGDIHALPFPDRSFDFIYCAHVMENVDDPIQASREIMRVGRRGYIETPTLGKDTLFGWARNFQRWHVVGIEARLCFFEYSDRQLSGVNSTVWRDLIFDKWEHPLQGMFWDNQDVFNVMFPWEGEFAVLVFQLDGTIRTLNATIRSAETTDAGGVSPVAVDVRSS
jgi:hypothetical protein